MGSTLLGTALLLLRGIDILRSSLPCCIELGQSRIDSGYVSVLMRFLQLAQRRFDGSLLVGRQLVAVLFELFLGSEDVRIGGVDLVNTLLLLFVLRLVSLGFVAHTLDLLLGKTRRSLDADLLLLTRTLIFSRYVQDAVGVDIEGYLDLRHTARSSRNAVQVEAADRLVVAGQRTLTLADVDLHRRLVVGRRREDLALPASRYPTTAE